MPIKRIVFFTFLILLNFNSASANLLLDSDRDGVSDDDEINVYYTDAFNPDTDGDGYSDWVELNSGFSPHNIKPLLLSENDYDGDGLSDRMELNFGTSLKNPDSDDDGYRDGEEIENGFNPLSKSEEKLEKRIEINLKAQKLSIFLGGVRMNEFLISSGINDSTPKGYFEIYNKAEKAWSSYGLWMPSWMAITQNGKYGIHELPIWPSGYTEGEEHLGTPASHGCVRLGKEEAKYLYKWAPIGTKVFIY